MSEKMTYTEEKGDEWPICPFCKQEIREIKYKNRGWFTTITAFWCPHCKSLLGTSTTFNG